MSVSVRMFSGAIGAQKLGHPVPDSNFVSELENRVVTANAPVNSLFVVLPILACESGLRSLPSSDLELLGIKRLLPFFVCLYDFFNHNLPFPLAGVSEFHQGYQVGFTFTLRSPCRGRACGIDPSRSKCAPQRKSSGEESSAAQALVSYKMPNMLAFRMHAPPLISAFVCPSPTTTRDGGKG